MTKNKKPHSRRKQRKTSTSHQNLSQQQEDDAIKAVEKSSTAGAHAWVDAGNFELDTCTVIAQQTAHRCDSTIGSTIDDAASAKEVAPRVEGNHRGDMLLGGGRCALESRAVGDLADLSDLSDWTEPDCVQVQAEHRSRSSLDRTSVGMRSGEVDEENDQIVPCERLDQISGVGERVDLVTALPVVPVSPPCSPPCSPPSLIVDSIQDSYSDQEDYYGLFLKALNKLVRVLAEFLETEVKFSVDVNKFKTVLTEIKYSTLKSARQVVSSAPYVGILVSTESIKITSNLLVSIFQETSVSPAVDDRGGIVPYTSVPECLSCCVSSGMAVFNGLARCAPYFPLFASFIINHDGLCELYREHVAADEDFSEYMGSVELLVGEGLLSLLIKPVQRLPREIHSCIAKAISLLDDDDQYFEQMNALLANSKQVLESMTTFTSKCNEAVRTHQDNLRMHTLQLAFQESGSDELMEGFVSNKRRIIREGQLVRHHKRIGEKFHEFQVFSDVMLSSSAVGSALRLEHVISLSKGCDTICLPIPAMFEAASIEAAASSTEWFFICSKKVMFCGAESCDKRDRWVADVTKRLEDNQADSDTYLMKKQIALVNVVIGQINALWKEKQISRGSNLPGEGNESPPKAENMRHCGRLDPMILQVSWWRLPQVLRGLEEQVEGCREGGGAASNSLQRVIDMHAKEVAMRILLRAQLVTDGPLAGDEVAHVGDRAGGGSFPSTASRAQARLTALLLNDQTHYLISSGFFFESGGHGAGASLSDGVRPQLLQLFLLNDVLFATYFDTVGAPLKYAFDINMCDLECNDYRTDVGHSAIQLVDRSVKASSRRFSLFSKAGGVFNQEKRERIVFAPSQEVKFEWLTLIMQTYERYRVTDSETSVHKLECDPLNLDRVPFPLERVGAVSTVAPWRYEEDTKPLDPHWI